MKEEEEAGRHSKFSNQIRCHITLHMHVHAAFASWPCLVHPIIESHQPITFTLSFGLLLNSLDLSFSCQAPARLTPAVLLSDTRLLLL